jgi:hypothetical protein
MQFSFSIEFRFVEMLPVDDDAAQVFDSKDASVTAFGRRVVR